MVPNRQIKVSSPLGDDVLLLRRMTAEEELGRLFTFELDLVSKDNQIRHEDILGQKLSVALDLPGKKKRYFNGLASRFDYVGVLGRHARYRAVIKPWLWFLTRTANCRIFQEMSAPDIITQLFRDRGFTDFEDALSRSYRTRDYCVQYRETDFDFVSRLMEEEGIYYYFKHKESKHTLVLADSHSAHDPFPGYEQIVYLPPDQEVGHEREYINDWRVYKEIQPGTFACKDFDMENPKANLEVKSNIGRGHEKADYEFYDYPGGYHEIGQGEAYAKTRIEEFHARYEAAEGKGNARGTAVGSLFHLESFPRPDQNREYLVIKAKHAMDAGAYDAMDTSPEAPPYVCDFTAMESKQPYRSPCLTPKPVVRGPQTAIVSGKAGEEIWTDQHGRIKVKFHWDRKNEGDEKSSCWVRVAQVWAGKGWGVLHLPRIGQEVVVEFLEGDPDRPLVTGRVYNGDNAPPFELPAHQTQSGIQSRSTKGGLAEHYNEIRMEDKKDEELLFIHAEKDMTTEVENDKRIIVDRNRNEDVKEDRSLTVGGNKSESVKKDKTVTISGSHTEGIEGDMTLSVKKDMTESVDGQMSLTVVKDRNTTIQGAYTVGVTKDETRSVEGNKSQKVTKNYMLKAKAIAVQADDEIVLKTGSASIQMKKNGDITIQGKKISVKGSGDVVIKGSKVTAN